MSPTLDLKFERFTRLTIIEGVLKLSRKNIIDSRKYGIIGSFSRLNFNIQSISTSKERNNPFTLEGVV